MRHATDAALDKLDDLLSSIRKRHPALRERKRGAFYKGGRGWLHFHEDSAGLFADLKIDGSFVRFRVSTKAEQGVFLHELRDSMGEASVKSKERDRQRFRSKHLLSMPQACGHRQSFGIQRRRRSVTRRSSKPKIERG